MDDVMTVLIRSITHCLRSFGAAVVAIVGVVVAAGAAAAGRSDRCAAFWPATPC